MQFGKGAQKSKGMVKNHMGIQEADQDHSGDTTGMPLKTQTRAVQAAATDNNALTEAIFFNSLP